MLKLVLLFVALVASLFALTGCGGLGNPAGLLTGTPAILAISPNPVVRGQAVTITGTSMNGTLTTAWFNGTYSSTASSGGATTVSVIVPTTMGAGTYSVYVVTNDGQGNLSAQSNSVTLSVQ